MIPMLLLVLGAGAQEPERIDVLFDVAAGISVFVHVGAPAERVYDLPLGFGVAVRTGPTVRAGVGMYAGAQATLNLHSLVDVVPGGFDASSPLFGVTLGGYVGPMNCPMDGRTVCPESPRQPYAYMLGPQLLLRGGYRVPIGAEQRNGLTIQAMAGLAHLVTNTDDRDVSGFYAGGLAGASLVFDL